MNASAFGYTPSTPVSLTIVDGTTTTQDFSLFPLPTGTIEGFVTEAGSGTPLAAEITVNQTPVTATTHPSTGAYLLKLPAGPYTLTVASPGHRVVSVKNVSVTAGLTTHQNIALPTAPTILRPREELILSPRPCDPFARIVRDCPNLLTMFPRHETLPVVFNFPQKKLFSLLLFLVAFKFKLVLIPLI